MSDQGQRPALTEAQKARRKRNLKMGLSALLLAVVTTVVVVLGATGKAGAETVAGYLTGVAAGAGVLAVAFWLDRRRGGSSFSRMYEGSLDERDKLIWQASWAFVGNAAFAAAGVVMALGALGVHLNLLHLGTALLWVVVIALFGARFFYEHRM